MGWGTALLSTGHNSPGRPILLPTGNTGGCPGRGGLLVRQLGPGLRRSTHAAGAWERTGACA